MIFFTLNAFYQHALKGGAGDRNMIYHVWTVKYIMLVIFISAGSQQTIFLFLWKMFTFVNDRENESKILYEQI